MIADPKRNHLLGEGFVVGDDKVGACNLPDLRGGVIGLIGIDNPIAVVIEPRLDVRRDGAVGVDRGDGMALGVRAHHRHPIFVAGPRVFKASGVALPPLRGGLKRDRGTAYAGPLRGHVRIEAVLPFVREGIIGGVKAKRDLEGSADPLDSRLVEGFVAVQDHIPIPVGPGLDKGLSRHGGV